MEKHAVQNFPPTSKAIYKLPRNAVLQTEGCGWEKHRAEPPVTAPCSGHLGYVGGPCVDWREQQGRDCKLRLRAK